jgi:hypothetical protein
VQSDAQRANLAAAEISEGNNLLFTGALFTRGAAAQVGAELNPLLPGGEARLEATEGLTLRVKAEGHVYACVLRTGACSNSALWQQWCVCLVCTGGVATERALNPRSVK